MTKQKFLLIVLHKGFESRPVGFLENENFPRFLFLNRGFMSTSDSYHVMVTQTRPPIDLVHQGRVSGQKQIQDVLMSGRLCYHLCDDKIIH